MAKSRDNDLFIVKDDGYIYYYQDVYKRQINMYAVSQPLVW